MSHPLGRVASRSAALIVAALCSRCTSSTRSFAPLEQGGKLSDGIVATVGSRSIATESVRRVAQRQRVGPQVALSYEVRDTLFAAAALGANLDEVPTVRAALRARLARIPLEALRNDVDTKEPTPAELTEATARHFVELDRPTTFRVVHALVKFPEKADASTPVRARGVADRLAETLARATNEADFRARVEAFTDRGGFDIVVETLKPVTADGRVADLEHPSPEPELYVEPFAAAASRLTTVGQKSGVVTTDFGFHTLMLLERLPEKRVPLDERAKLLREEILRERAKRLKGELLDRLRAETPNSIERNADTLLTTVGKDHDAF